MAWLRLSFYLSHPVQTTKTIKHTDMTLKSDMIYQEDVIVSTHTHTHAHSRTHTHTHTTKGGLDAMSTSTALSQGNTNIHCRVCSNMQSCSFWTDWHCPEYPDAPSETGCSYADKPHSDDFGPPPSQECVGELSVSKELVLFHFPSSFLSEGSPCLLYPAAPIGLWVKMMTTIRFQITALN